MPKDPTEAHTRARPVPPELISLPALARTLGTDERTLRKMAVPGRVMVGRTIRFKRRAVERWLEQDGG